MINNQIINEWLNTEINKGRTTLSRLAELVAVNYGRTIISEVENVRNDNISPYGRLGLTVNEALELMNYVGQITGMMYIIDDTNDDLQKDITNLIISEIDRVKKEGFGNDSSIGRIKVYTVHEMKSIKLK